MQKLINMFFKSILTVIGLIITSWCFAQDENAAVKTKKFEFKEVLSRKGRMYLYWGYNRSSYTTSTIHFIGDDYDLKFADVEATDRPSKLAADPYLDLGKFTIPQFNIRLGYYLNDRLSLSLGTDHMKYIMKNNQLKQGTGFIDTVGGTRVDYDKFQMLIGNDFVYLEHSDGFNYASIDLGYNLPVWISPSKKFYVDAIGGFGLGLTVPKTLVVINGVKLDNKWHVSGGGINLKAGARFTFWTNFFFEGAAKTGYVWMPNILTTEIGSAQAKQNLGWVEVYMAIGISVPLIK